MNIQTFLLHHPLIPDRKNNLLNDLGIVNYKYPLSWVEDFLPNDIQNKYPHTITLAELSLSLKHQYCVTKQFNENIDFIIIFEDDIDLLSVPNLNPFIEQCLQEIEQNNADILWFGGTYGLQVPSEIRTSNKTSYFSNNFLSRCTHGYILNKKASKTILDNYHYNLPVDHLYNEIIHHTKLVSGWTHPFLTQKTVEGIWRSTIR